MFQSTRGSRRLAVITGASKGFGSAVAKQLSARHPDTDFILIGRDQTGLDSTVNSLQPDSDSYCLSVDICNHAQFERQVKKVLVQLSPARYSGVYLIHNAGTIGVASCQELSNLAGINDYYSLNLSSMVFLTASFLEICSGHTKLYVVNISSAWGVSMFPAGFSLYSSGKAARKAYMQCLAAENLEGVRTLSYSPGIMATNMQTDIQNAEYNAPSKDFVGQVIEKGLAVDTAQSADILIDTLDQDAFANDAHVDVYDVRPDLFPKM
eukprot:CAMPEP_0177651762 /NCGR_PEP_ID=MMETSP0447-20121125/12733_1 /TAXON_ID=0 /ORGANISM="Stygamoeba regulata, Strain BSH-02190019" /LENGTH=265 /DNA_ID=CAMNT_0019154889 /DNA_START=18 /DNA_END=815 /DNA_ORIENTATION=+